MGTLGVRQFGSSHIGTTTITVSDLVFDGVHVITSNQNSASASERIDSTLLSSFCCCLMRSSVEN
jgi:hypothetical protein